MPQSSQPKNSLPLALLGAGSTLLLLVIAAGPYHPEPKDPTGLSTSEPQTAERSTPAPKAVDRKPASTPSAKRSSQNPSSASNLIEFLKSESREAEQLQELPESAERRVQNAADMLNDEQRWYLVSRVLASGVSASEKEVAVLLLKRDLPDSLPQLEQIAIAPIHARAGDHLEAGALASRHDLALRISATEAIETAVLSDSAHFEKLVRIAEKAQEPLIRDLARLSLEQVERGKSFFEAYFERIVRGNFG